MTDPIELLEDHRERLRELRAALEERRAKLETLGATLASDDRDDLTDEQLDDLVQWLEAHERNMAVQVDDIEGDLEMIADLQSTFEEVNQLAVERELDQYADELATVFDDKRQSVEELIDVADEMIDHFEEIVTGRYADQE